MVLEGCDDLWVGISIVGVGVSIYLVMVCGLVD